MYKGICPECKVKLISGYKNTTCWNCDCSFELTEKLSKEDELKLLNEFKEIASELSSTEDKIHT